MEKGVKYLLRNYHPGLLPAFFNLPGFRGARKDRDSTHHFHPENHNRGPEEKSTEKAR